jgi:hypothetical protein
MHNPVLGHPGMHNADAKDTLRNIAINTRDDAMMEEAVIHAIDD